MTKDTQAVNEDRIFEIYNEFHYVCDKRRFQKIFSRTDLFKMVMDLPGDIVDAGIYKGISTIQFVHLLETYQPNSRTKVLGFDTFEDHFPNTRPDEVKVATDHMRTFEPNIYERLTETFKRQKLEHRVELIKGNIIESLTKQIKDNPGFRISLLHCDMDVYLPTLKTLELAWPRIVPGGMIIFDEYAVNAWGESDAVDEFLAKLKHPVRLKIPQGSPTPTAYCIKEAYE